MNKVIINIWLILFFVAPAHAYLGPGMGGGIITVVIGILGAVILGLFAIIYYPIKRALKKLRSSDLSKQTHIDANASSEEEP